MYELDESLQAWVQVTAGYHSFFETANPSAGWDPDVSPTPPDGGRTPPPGGGDPGDPPPGGGQQPNAKILPSADGDAGILCMGGDPTNFLPVTVTGLRPTHFGGSVLTLIWRGQMLASTQRSVGGGSNQTPPALPAPSGTAPVTCSDEIPVKMENAEYVATHYGWTALNSRNKTMTIRYSTGTTETCRSLGLAGGAVWMVPVAGTCRDQS